MDFKLSKCRCGELYVMVRNEPCGACRIAERRVILSRIEAEKVSKWTGDRKMTRSNSP